MSTANRVNKSLHGDLHGDFHPLLQVQVCNAKNKNVELIWLAIRSVQQGEILLEEGQSSPTYIL